MNGSHTHPSNGINRKQFAQIVFPSAILLQIFVAYSILVHVYSLNLDTKELPMDGVLFCILWLLLFSSFLRGAFTSPGLVEKGWYKRYPVMHKNLRMRFSVYKKQMSQQKEWMKRFNKSEEETTLLIEDEDENENENTEFPDNFARPPRSHFCFELGSNILRMDHFCVWFNNAVGFFNYKYFLLAILYLLALSLLSICILIYRIFVRHYIADMHFGMSNIICLLFSSIICLFFLVFSAMHTSMHLWQSSKSLTSIEYHKYSQIKAMAKHFDIPFPNTHEFDHGIFANLRKMLGTDVWFWLVPFSPSLPEDGYKFHINYENKTKIENVTNMISAKQKQLWKKNRLTSN